MIEIKDSSILGYVTRDVRNYGLHKKGELYNYRFTREDNILLNSGAIKLFPLDFYKFTSNVNAILGGEKHIVGQELDKSKFDDEVLKMLIRTHMVKIEMKDEYKNIEVEDLIANVQTNSYIGKTFKQVAEEKGIEFEIIKEAFGLKQGGAKKKVTEKDLELLQTL